MKQQQEIPPLPDDIIELVRQLSDDTDNLQFALGDLLVSVIDELGDAYKPYSSEPKNLIVSLVSNRTGVGKNTLHDRERVCRSFPKETREKYPFTYGQWRALRKAGDKWKEYADHFADNLPAPVHVIEEKIRRDKTGEPPWVSRFTHLMEIVIKLQRDEEAPDYVRRCARSMNLAAGIAFGEFKKGKWKLKHS